jgi:hypothetical protein
MAAAWGGAHFLRCTPGGSFFTERRPVAEIVIS